MIKGTSRRVIVVKNPGTDVFEEAYFIIKEGKMKRKSDHKTLLSEASKILEENGSERDRRSLTFINVLSFFLGAFAAVIIFYIINL